MDADHLTWGQKLALDQLSDIAAASNGAVEVVQTELPSTEGGSLVLRLSIETGGYERAEAGFSFRKREGIRIFVPSKFPIAPPSANFAHNRFMGKAHVQWGNHMCLYQATDVEWAPSDGMFGFFKRLDDWLRDAAKNELDPNDAPLHPPVEYHSSDTRFVVEIDAPEIDKGANFWMGATKLAKRNKYTYDLSEWTETPKTLPDGERFAAVVLLGQAMPTEYPETISTLITALEARGLPFTLLFSLLKVLALCQEKDEPLYFVLGAPMRRRAADEPIRQHLTAWKMASEHVEALKAIVLEESGDASEAAWGLILDWATKAKTEWCRVYDNRPEVTFRRDRDTSASWFLGKSVALLGCGAIGSHIGEYLVRAGASKLRLVDQSYVNPGILVRQQFEHRQVGFTKQSALAVELSAINPKADIDHKFANLTKGWPDAVNLDEFDLIIDATASRRVSSALQLGWSDVAKLPPILRCAISGDASHGIATMRLPTSYTGPAELIRQTKMAAFDRPELSDFAEAFWPQGQQEAGFQPEPGCSEPTFVGSAADIAFFASSFFNFASRVLTNPTDDAASAIFVRAATNSIPMSSCEVPLAEHTFSNEAFHSYRVSLSLRAKKTIESEMRSNARSGSDKDETGGLLLGEIDDPLQTISIDIATGPPPDSEKSPELFLCGVEGTEQLCKHHAERTGNSTRFVGVWHTHPVSMPKPSDVDVSALANILHLQAQTPRHVVMLIIGHAATTPDWRFHLFRKRDFRQIVLEAVEKNE